MALIDPSSHLASELAAHLGIDPLSDHASFDPAVMAALLDLNDSDQLADEDEDLDYVPVTREVTIRRTLGQLVWFETRTVRVVIDRRITTAHTHRSIR